jgi:tRNA threonylcarbamoyl adenosine modification protein YeaZ
VLVLAFDTATAAVTVALGEWSSDAGARIRASAREIDGRRHAELLTPAIAKVLAEADVGVDAVDAIAVGVGPGPYTGLRVGLVTARSLGDALRLPVHGVCTLDVLAWESRRDTPFVVATDARRKEVYWARYQCARRRVSGPEVGKPVDVITRVRGDEVAGVPGAGLPVVGPAGPLYPEALGAPQVPLLVSAGALAELVMTRLAGADGPELLPPRPLYLRRPDAREPGPVKKVTRP